MTFLYKTVCQDDFVADVEEIQNTGDIAALFCPNSKRCMTTPLIYVLSYIYYIR